MMLQTRMIYFDDLVGKFQESKVHQTLGSGSASSEGA
jgi:hypothetical protein